MSVERISDHADQAVNRLPGWLRGKPKLEAVVRAFMRPIQEIEDAYIALILMKAIDTAEGVWLDKIGKLVGQDRGSLTDTIYRRYLRARIAANRSNGLIEDVIRVVRLILDDASVRVQVRNLGGCEIIVELEDVAVADDVADVVLSFMPDTVAAGIGARVVHASESDIDYTYRLGVTAYGGAVSVGASNIVTDGLRAVGAFPQSNGLIELRGIDAGGDEHCEVIRYASFERDYNPGGGLSRFRFPYPTVTRYDYAARTNRAPGGGVVGPLITLVEPDVERAMDHGVSIPAGSFDVAITLGVTVPVEIPQGIYTARQFAALVDAQLWIVDSSLYAGVSWDAFDGWRFFVGALAGSITVQNFSSTEVRDALGYATGSIGPTAAAVATSGILSTANGGLLARLAEV